MALSRFQADHQLVATGVIDFPTYERSLRDYVSVSTDGKLARVGWEPKGDAGNQPAATQIRLHIENIMLQRTAFEVGEQIFVSASLSKTAYMYCYMASARGTVIRLLPNNTNTSGWIQANQTIRIPDWMSPNPGFVMDASAPGTEGVACFATDGDIRAQLPASLQSQPFTVMEGVTNLDELEALFRSAPVQQRIAANKLTWQVVAKPVTTPPPATEAAPAANNAPSDSAAPKAKRRAASKGRV